MHSTASKRKKYRQNITSDPQGSLVKFFTPTGVCKDPLCYLIYPETPALVTVRGQHIIKHRPLNIHVYIIFIVVELQICFLRCLPPVIKRKAEGSKYMVFFFICLFSACSCCCFIVFLFIYIFMSTCSG